MTLLSLVQRVTNSPGVGIAEPTVVVTSGDLAVLELLELAQQEGEELSRRGNWPELITEKTFTTTAAAAQTGAIPSDFERFVDQSWFNRSSGRRLIGPLSPVEWQAIQANAAAATVDYAFRIRGTSFLVTPTPPATLTFAYEYITKNWCQSSGGTGQALWAADTDTGVISERLMTLGIIWRWRKKKELAWGGDFDTYEEEVEKALGRAGGSKVLSLAPRRPRYPNFPTIPDGGWAQ